MEQIEKNTVSAVGQLKPSDYISYINPQNDGRGIRLLVAGNSIARHGIKKSIGWNNDFGMAASSAENDFVHVLTKKYEKSGKNPITCVCQLANWEWNYKRGSDVLKQYEAARSFKADILVIRIVENCPFDSFEPEVFKRKYKKLIDYLNPTGEAQIVITTGFWKHIADSCIRDISSELNIKCVELNDLGEMDEMKALGFFQHEGVANHPGDKGMQAIADRIFSALMSDG